MAMARTKAPPRRAAAHVDDAGAAQLVERVAHDGPRDAEARRELVVARQPRARA